MMRTSNYRRSGQLFLPVAVIALMAIFGARMAFPDRPRPQVQAIPEQILNTRVDIAITNANMIAFLRHLSEASRVNITSHFETTPSAPLRPEDIWEVRIDAAFTNTAISTILTRVREMGVEVEWWSERSCLVFKLPATFLPQEYRTVPKDESLGPVIGVR